MPANRNGTSYWEAVWWHVDDVLQVAPNLTDKEAKIVLTIAVNNHDPSVGITWDVLKQIADNLKSKEE